jgi:glycerophosphoryl diester phosphodiesterase
VPTFAQVAALAKRFGVGVYPELKHPTYFREQVGIDLEALLLRDLKALGLDRPGSPVFVQSFEEATVRRLARALRVPAVQLLPAYGSAPTLELVGSYAEGVGPAKGLATQAFVDAAHAEGLQVHPYTFRNENQFLPPDLRVGDDPKAYGNAIAEYERFFARGVDGVFSDNPDTAVEARG